MENYYKLLDLHEKMGISELQETLKTLQRKWQARTNAPSIERRQEAERMLVYISKAKEVFENSDKKKVYDNEVKQLESSEIIDTNLDSTNNAVELLNNAKDEINNDRIAEALLILKKALLLDSKSYEIHANYGYCLMKMERFLESIQSYETALALDGSIPIIYHDLILVHLELENYNAAKEYLNQALQKFDDEIIFLDFRAFFYNKEGEYNKTIKMLEEYKKNDYKLEDHLLSYLCEAYEKKALEVYKVDDDGDFVLTTEADIDYAVRYWEKIVPYRHIYKDTYYPQRYLQEVKDLKIKRFSWSKWKMFILPIIFCIASISDPELTIVTFLMVLYIAFLIFISFIPGYKINYAAVTKKKLVVDYFHTLNWGFLRAFGLLVLFIFSIIIASEDSGSN